ncbi:hypothetical protein [Brachyspira intermedia]
MIKKFKNNNYNDSVIFNDDYNSLIEEYNDIIKDNISEKENESL